MKIKNSIELKTLFLILLFNVGVIIIFYFCQIFAYSYYYKKYQINNLNNIINIIKNSKEDITLLAKKLAYEKEVCIEIIDENNINYYFNNRQNGCNLNNKNVKNIINNFINDDKILEKYNIYDNEIGGLLYGLKCNNNNIFIYSNLTNISKFRTMFQSVVTYFMGMILILSLLVSVFLANKITKPIRQITKKAKNIGDGKYNIKFPKNGIKEIDELSKTLEDVQEELSRSDEAKKDLIANVSHDLKTPLTMIKAYAEKIKDISYKDKDNMDNDLDIIINESDRLTLLVNDILNLSNMQNNSYNYNYAKYNIVNEINKIINNYSLIKETENYNFNVILPKKAYVYADKNKLNQVIYNLINNAINYTGNDKVVKIELINEINDYTFKVTDTGKGINKDDIPYIWNKYYKNDKNHQRNIISTGLGLSIVKEILDKHNFEYGVISKKNKGTTFYFKIKK